MTWLPPGRVGVVTGHRLSLEVADCWEDDVVGEAWVVGVVSAESSPVLDADGSELFAVLDNPALEWVDPVGVGEPLAEFRWLSEASCDRRAPIRRLDGWSGAPLKWRC